MGSTLRLLFLAAIWGGSFLFFRIGAPVFGPGVLIELRLGIAAVFLWGVCRWWLRRRLDWRRHWRHFFVVGLFNSALPFVLLAFAAQTLSASLLSVLNSSSPLFGALVAAAWLRQWPSWPAACGLALGIAGVVVLAWGGLGAGDDTAWGAVAASLLASLSYGVATTYAGRPVAAVDPIDNAHGSLWCATLLVLPAAWLIPVPQIPGPLDWLAVVLFGVVCTGFAFLLYFRLIQDVGPMRALSVTFLIPIFGVLWGVLLLDEQVGWNTLFGGVLVLLGTALTNGVLGRA
jgi:drug/metabolite transporter (DMT)-like permease